MHERAEQTEHDDGQWTTFRRSSFSGDGGCVEVAFSSRSGARVRDSKTPDAPSLTFNRTEWQAFLDGVRDGQFDLPD